MFCLLISVSCRHSDLKVACSYIAALALFTLNFFCGSTFYVSFLSSFPRLIADEHLFVLCGLWSPSRLTCKSGVSWHGTAGRRLTHLILLWDDYLSDRILKRAQNFFRPPFALFLCERAEALTLYSAMLALRRSPSCKTRSVGYTTIAQLSSRREKEERKRRRRKRKAEKLVFYSGTIVK